MMKCQMIVGESKPERQSTKNVQYKPTIKQPVWAVAITCDAGKHILLALDFSHFSNDSESSDSYVKVFIDGANELYESTKIGYCRRCDTGKPVTFGKIAKVLGWDRYHDVCEWINILQSAQELPQGITLCDGSTCLDSKTMPKKDAQQLQDATLFFDRHGANGFPLGSEVRKAIKADKRRNHTLYPKVSDQMVDRFKRNGVPSFPVCVPLYYAINMKSIRQALRWKKVMDL